jgi:hypothetical protein
MAEHERRGVRRRASPRVAAAASVAFTFAAPPARAADMEVTSDTSAQFYDLRGPTGETVLARRRVTTSLGVSAYDLLGEQARDPKRLGPELSFRARMRYDADYGADGAETQPQTTSRFVPGFSRGPVDLMYGYVEGRRFVNGWLGFKLGRQYVTDALGWWSFDGGAVRVTTPVYVAVEAYGGLEVRGGMPLSTPRFERDGIWRGDRAGFDPSLYPSFQPSDIAPAFGAAIESAGITWIHGRLTYRRVANTGASNVSQFASGTAPPITYSDARISSERIGYAMDASLARLGGVKAGLAYDLYVAKFASIYASLDAFLTPRLTLSLDYDYYAPTYDADSIWNFFASEPMNDFGLRGSFDATDNLNVSASTHARMYAVQTAPEGTATSPGVSAAVNPSYFPTNGAPFDEGGTLAARYRFGEGSYGVRGSGNWGDGGERVGADVYGERRIETRYVFSGRASLWQWNDKLRPDRDATNVGYVAGVGYVFGPRARAMFEFEHNMNRLVGQRFRAMLWLTLAVTK